jgi:hypothetical protein
MLFKFEGRGYEAVTVPGQKMFGRLLRLQRARLVIAVSAFLVLVYLFIFFGMRYATSSADPDMSTFFKTMLPGGTSACDYSTNFQCESCLDCAANNAMPIPAQNHSRVTDKSWRFTFGRDDKNLALDDAQCDSAFPGLFEEPDRAMRFYKDKRIILEDVKSIPITGDGMVHAMIYDKEVCFYVYLVELC